MRDHRPLTIDKFGGDFDRNDESCPVDHFENSENLRFIGDNVTVRPGVDISQTVAAPLENVKRIFNYPTQTANTTLVLTYDGTTGKIYHVINASTVFLILTIVGMEDFAFVPYAGRAYITPFKNFVTGDLNIQKGMQSQFLYVYDGLGVTAARKAAGLAPVGTLTIANGAAGHTDPGFKIFGVVFESDTGWLSPPAAFATFNTAAGSSVSFGTVPVGAIGQNIVKRHIVSTINITGYNGNLEGYQFFFIPNGTINNNVDLFLNNVSFFDGELLEDASHLLDNYAEIPAGCALSIYHDRLCLSTTFNDISLILVSNEGEPEAINQLTGLIIVPLDGNPITNHAELRDILYVFKRTRCIGYIDNGDEPSTWKFTVVDNALGAMVHSIATVLDSGSSTVDYLIIANYSGVYIFNGRFSGPLELSWKIAGFWDNLDRDNFRKIQIVIEPIRKLVLMCLPDGTVCVGDYNYGMDHKNIRWHKKWSFNVTVNCLAIVNIDEIIIGADI
jgi:hypothetical protein